MEENDENRAAVDETIIGIPDPATKKRKYPVPPANGAGKKPSKRDADQAKKDFLLLSEVVEAAPYGFPVKDRAGIWATIAVNLNATAPIGDRSSRNGRNCKERTESLLDGWGKKDRAEVRVTGGGEVEEESPVDQFLRQIAAEKEKCAAETKADLKKKSESADIVDSIQAKAKLVYKQKVALSESGNRKTGNYQSHNLNFKR